MQRSPAATVADGAASGATQIDAQGLIDSAQMAGGVFGPLAPDLDARVRKLVDWLNAQAPLADERRFEVALQLRKLLITRLRLGADRARIPAIAQERIERPIFVIGFARTGTTLIHSLLAEDPSARAPKWWQTHDPSPPPGEGPVAEGRIEFAGKDLDRLIHLAPGLLTLHPYWDKRGHALVEDEEIFTLDFQNAYPTLLYRLPTLALILDASSAPDAYRFHRQFLQHLQWNRPAKHWVVKGVYHQFVLDALFEAYPDAICVWPHRDPVEVHPSTLAITAALYGAISDWTMDFKALGPAFVDSIRQSLDQVLANPLLDDPRIVHLDFKALMRDPVAAIRTVYDRAGLAFSEAFEARMRAWLADPANRGDRYGRYGYAPEPFGLTHAGLKADFAAYRERFNFA